MGLLPDTWNCGLRMRRECRERFPRHRRLAIPTCVIHVPWCMPGSLTSGFLWSRWRGKCSQHSRRIRNPQFCVSGKKPIAHCCEKTKPLIQRNQHVPDHHVSHKCNLFSIRLNVMIRVRIITIEFAYTTLKRKCYFVEICIAGCTARGGGGGGEYSAWKLMGVCRWPLKIGPKKIEEKIEFGAKKIDFCKNW